MPWINFFSNPVWRARGVFHVLPANAPTLYDYDSIGVATPSGGRTMGAAESAQVAEYNLGRYALDQANRDAIDAVMGRFLPLSDSLYNPLSTFEATQLTNDVSWLADHNQGDDFYNDLDNFTVSINGDDEGYFREGRMSNTLDKANLNVDEREVEEKVATGVSSPIVIDLNGDGIRTTSAFFGKTVNFDIDGDGKVDKTAWISEGDAFLAVDRNGNGRIDGASELFGGKNRGYGYALLSEYDSNGDYKIDQFDDKYSDLLLWQDKNSDGVTDVGELLTAAVGGLESTGVDYFSQEVRQNGNLFGEVSKAIVNGKEVQAADIYFRYSQINPDIGLSIDAGTNLLISAMSNFSIEGASTTQMSTLDPLIISPLVISSNPEYAK